MASVFAAFTLAMTLFMAGCIYGAPGGVKAYC